MVVSAREPGDQLDLPIARREFYSIGDACEITGLKAHVLRYWESQFDVLKPQKNRAGNRVFLAKDIEMILLVKRLLQQDKYTIEGARQKLDQLRRSGELKERTSGPPGADLLAELAADLKEILEVLTPATAGAQRASS
jgi:DNA-binding transcriptional MerR regulator